MEKSDARSLAEMGKLGYLAMDSTNEALIQSDFNEIGVAMKKLANHAFHLSAGLGFGTTFFKFFASFSAMYLFFSLGVCVCLGTRSDCLVIKFGVVVMKVYWNLIFW